MFSKAQILAEIKRTSAANDGVPLGKARFETETGIKESDWAGRYWARWTEAVAEAGYAPNARTGRRADDDVLEPLARMSRDLGRIPSRDEMRLAARRSGFPASLLGRRYRGRSALASALADFCRRSPDHADVLALCDTPSSPGVGREGQGGLLGYVYLLRSGHYYKVGRSNAVGRRERELQIQLPERANEVHRIATDDPVGIEHYWHARFQDRRKNGEWFKLSAEDIRAFRRRKFM